MPLANNCNHCCCSASSLVAIVASTGGTALAEAGEQKEIADKEGDCGAFNEERGKWQQKEDGKKKKSIKNRIPKEKSKSITLPPSLPYTLPSFF